MFKIIDGNVCAPQGFLATGVYAGIRKSPKKLDLALIYSETPAVAAGVFTKNRIKAAPILLTKKHLKNHEIQAIVINSGNANACTGDLGILHATQMAKTAALGFGIKLSNVAIASTGVIGEILPIQKVIHGIEKAMQEVSFNGGDIAAQAIMTTDTFPKSIAIEVKLGGKLVRIGGIAKGSGMIHPNMATMLAFITTDTNISPEALRQALRAVNQMSFNMVIVDGETSTNDMAMLLANGKAKNPKINSSQDSDWRIFYKALSFVCTFLAKEIARDGEGATKLIETKIRGARTEQEARLAARAVCSSPLVKTTIFGEDPNWGRIACAIGYSGAVFNLEGLKIEIGNIPLFGNGKPQPYDEGTVRDILKEKTITITVNLGAGKAKACAWGCDLTYDYIKINAAYRS
jgi:glutamate N-acetyltransferase / amino-acid N-acetyltransferase